MNALEYTGNCTTAYHQILREKLGYLALEPQLTPPPKIDWRQRRLAYVALLGNIPLLEKRAGDFHASIRSSLAILTPEQLETYGYVQAWAERLCAAGAIPNVASESLLNQLEAWGAVIEPTALVPNGAGVSRLIALPAGWSLNPTDRVPTHVSYVEARLYNDKGKAVVAISMSPDPRGNNTVSLVEPDLSSED